MMLRDSFSGPHGGGEWELYLGRMAIDLGEYEVARTSLRYFVDKRLATNAIGHTTLGFWPKGATVKSLHAALLFLDAVNRFDMDAAEAPLALSFLRKADQLEPGNVAINYGLGTILRQTKQFWNAMPYYKFVAEKATGHLQKAAAKRYEFLKKSDLKPPTPNTAGGGTSTAGG